MTTLSGFVLWFLETCTALCMFVCVCVCAHVCVYVYPYVCLCSRLQRENLGACSKIHSEAIRREYEKASQKEDYNMEEEVSTAEEELQWMV